MTDHTKLLVISQATFEMFETERTLMRFSIGYLKRLCADLSDEDLQTLTDATGKTPQWILGHLRIGAEFGIKLLGGEPSCTQDWFTAFGPGSEPTAEGAPTFSVASAMEDITESYQRLLGMLESASEEQLNSAHAFEPLKEGLPTNRDLLSHLLCTHFTYHLAQLSACRQSKGIARIF